MKRKNVYEFEGSDVVVRWDRLRCIHAERCVHGSPEVFDPNRRPWIDPDRADVEAVAAVVWECPTGALHFTHTSGDRVEPIPESTHAQTSVDGPLYVKGRLLIGLPGGAREPENRAALCRCGASKNKPFCDNSHLAAGFSDDGSLGAAMLAPGDDLEPSSTVEVSSIPNGPLIVRGPIEIHSADGAETQKGGKGALCRCGASQNRPYCDGSHAAAGFEAE